jgi:hypothetical protein
VVIVLIGAGGSYFLIKGGSPNAAGSPAASTTPDPTGTADPTSTPTPTPTPTPAPTSRERVTAPSRVGQFQKSTDPSLTGEAQNILTEIKSGVPDSTSAVAAYYQNSNKTELVLLAAASGTIADPAGELDRQFQGATDIQNVRSVSPGPLGGSAKCGTEGSGGATIILCAWADHGSLGIVGFGGMSTSQAASLLIQFRSAATIR